MLKTLLIRFGWVVFERSQKVFKKKVKKKRKFDFSEGHYFCVKNLRVTACPRELLTTRLFDWNLRFGSVSFWEVKKFQKTVKNQKFDFSECYNFFLEKPLEQGSIPEPVLSVEPKIQIWEGSFWENVKKPKRLGSKIPPHTFSQAVESEVRLKETRGIMQAQKGVSEFSIVATFCGNWWVVFEKN